MSMAFTKKGKVKNLETKSTASDLTIIYTKSTDEIPPTFFMSSDTPEQLSTRMDKILQMYSDMGYDLVTPVVYYVTKNKLTCVALRRREPDISAI
jgi:hypothetical protein